MDRLKAAARRRLHLLTLRTLIALAGAWFAAAGCWAQSLAVTVDDLPAHSAVPPGEMQLGVAQSFLRTFQAAGLPPVYGFVNGRRLEDTPGTAGVLESWSASGNLLGNHAWSHMDLNKNSLEAWQADVLADETVLKAASAPANDWHWLRFPFVSEGDTSEKRAGARRFLQEHGYRIAAVTMSFGDYAWNEPYARCMAAHDESAVQRLESSYLQAARDDIRYRRALAQAAFGHDIPYVLLLHMGAMDARMLPRLLALYREAGFHFVTLDEAETDPFYASDVHLQSPGTGDSLEAAAAQHGTGMQRPHPSAFPPELTTLCRGKGL